jgi:hypothetical protein
MGAIAMVFAVECPRHGSRILLFTRNLKALRNTPLGIEVHYRCTCGYEGVWLTGGSRARPAPVAMASACS